MPLLPLLRHVTASRQIESCYRGVGRLGPPCFPGEYHLQLRPEPCVVGTLQLLPRVVGVFQVGPRKVVGDLEQSGLDGHPRPLPVVQEALPLALQLLHDLLREGGEPAKHRFDPCLHGVFLAPLFDHAHDELGQIRGLDGILRMCVHHVEEVQYS
jgi:hypothetical protein